MPSPRQVPLCSIDGCHLLAKAPRGWCWSHYQRWRRTGAPTPLSRRCDGNMAAHFWAKVDKSGECWVWTGTRQRSGYGAYHWRENGARRNARAHRYAYELIKGPIPVGLELDHLCRNKPCVRPDHLEPVTRADNKRRTRLTHCLRGHEYSLENTKVAPSGKRCCRQCQRIRDAAPRSRGRGCLSEKGRAS